MRPGAVQAGPGPGSPAGAGRAPSGVPTTVGHHRPNQPVQPAPPFRARTVAHYNRVTYGTQVCSVEFEDHIDVVVISAEDFEAFLRDNMKDAETAIGYFRDIRGAYKDIMPLYREFGIRGRAYEKTIRGKRYIVLKGKAGLRKIFRGTKYAANNTKVISYGLGRVGAVKSIKGGTVASLVFVNAFNIAEYFLSEEKSMVDLGVQVTSDSLKVLLSTAAAVAAGAAMAALGTPVIVPLAAGFVVSLVVGVALDKIDEKFHLTESLKTWALEVAQELKYHFDRASDWVVEGVQEFGRDVYEAIPSRQEIRQTRDRFLEGLDHTYDEWRRWFDDMF